MSLSVNWNTKQFWMWYTGRSILTYIFLNSYLVGLSLFASSINVPREEHAWSWNGFQLPSGMFSSSHASFLIPVFICSDTSLRRSLRSLDVLLLSSRFCRVSLPWGMRIWEGKWHGNRWARLARSWVKEYEKDRSGVGFACSFKRRCQLSIAV